ncbi:MAG: hypothetical protein ACYTDY_13680 [Planctomycetota bacterium]|jgi:type VI secretion system VasD/TssJ family lipoprotein
MRAALILSLAAVLVAPGCGVLLSYSPDDRVKITVETPYDLNTYGDDKEPHPVHVYFFKVSDLATFNTTEAGDLKGGDPVSGVEAAKPVKAVVRPGRTEQFTLEPMRMDHWKLVGVVAGFRQGNVKGVCEIPYSAELRLVLGPNEILSFQD